MRYYGGGIGHLNNTPPQQADPLDSNSNEMDVEEDTEDGNDTRDGPQVIIMNDEELEVDETEEEARSGDNDSDDGEDSGDDYDYGENDERGDDSNDNDSDEEDDYGYASP